jgi:endo-1,4-beta-mannosidase
VSCLSNITKHSINITGQKENSAVSYIGFGWIGQMSTEAWSCKVLVSWPQMFKQNARSKSFVRQYDVSSACHALATSCTQSRSVCQLHWHLCQPINIVTTVEYSSSHSFLHHLSHSLFVIVSYMWFFILFLKLVSYIYVLLQVGNAVWHIWTQILCRS